MKHILIGLLAFSSVAMACRPTNETTSTAQQTHVETSQSLTSYNAISITGRAKVYYTQSDQAPYYELSNPNNWKEIPTVEVKNGVLCIDYKLTGRNNIDGREFPTIHVYGPDVSQIKLDGSGDFIMNDLHSDNHMDITLNGSGDITFNELSTKGDVRLTLIGSGDIDLKQTTCNQFHATLRGSGDIDLEHVKCDQLHTILRGSGDINIVSMACSTLHTSLNGSGDIKLSTITAEKVVAKLDGSGDVELKGNCEQADLTLKGTGDLDAFNLQANHVRATQNNGSGSLKCHAVKTLQTQTNGSERILYTGNPKVTATGKAPHRK